MRLKCTLLVLLVALLPFVDTHSAERQKVFHSEANGYSVAIPEGWKQVPGDLVEGVLKAVFTEEGRPAHNYEVVLAVNWDDSQIKLPYLNTQVTRYSGHSGKRQLTRGEIADFMKALTSVGMDTETAKEHRTDEAQRRMANARLSNVSVDEESMVYSFSMQGENAVSGKYKSTTVGHMGRYATVQLIFICLESDWSRLESQRNLMFDSFAFDEGMRYEDAPGKRSRILNVLGWGAVIGLSCLLGPLVVALIGAMVLAIITAVLKPAKKESNDQEE